MMTRQNMGDVPDYLDWLPGISVDDAINEGHVSCLFKSAIKDVTWRVHLCAFHVDDEHCGQDPWSYLDVTKWSFANVVPDVKET